MIGDLKFYNLNDMFLFWKKLLKEEFSESKTINGKNKFFLITHYFIMINCYITINCNIKLANTEIDIDGNIDLNQYKYDDFAKIRENINTFIRDVILKKENKYSIRRQVIDNLLLKQKVKLEPKNNYWDDDEINELSFFSKKNIDDDILDKQICYGLNTIERLLKLNGSYIKKDFIVFNNDFIKHIKNKFQMFRHASRESLTDRKKYSIEEKLVILNTIIMICKDIKL